MLPLRGPYCVKGTVELLPGLARMLAASRSMPNMDVVPATSWRLACVIGQEGSSNGHYRKQMGQVSRRKSATPLVRSNMLRYYACKMLTRMLLAVIVRRKHIGQLSISSQQHGRHGSLGRTSELSPRSAPFPCQCSLKHLGPWQQDP